MNFYWYIIYRLYQFFSKKDTTPISDTVMILCFVHLIQLYIIYMYINIFTEMPRLGIEKGNLVFTLCLFVLFYIYYLIFFKNGKWKIKIKQFKKETELERKRKGIYVWLFCWGSIIFFFLSLPITFTIIRLYNPR
jgi:type III secretory pathway component EscU